LTGTAEKAADGVSRGPTLFGVRVVRCARPAGG